MYISYNQDNWQKQILVAQLALNARNSSFIGVSPFFLEHGYNLEILNLDKVSIKKQIRNLYKLGELIVRKLKNACK
jgi:flagellar assembly factor FliW